MMALRWALGCLFFSVHSYAASIVDVYGLDQQEGEALLQKYAKPLAHMAEPLKGGDMNFLIDEHTPQRKLYSTRSHALIDTMKKQEGFAFIDIDFVYYPDENNHYFTIEVVKPDQKNRLHFINALPAKPFVTTHVHQHDVMDSMSDYVEKGVGLVFAQQFDGNVTHCPVYHCSLGFERPELKPYLSVFNQAAKQQKALILATLNDDPDPERRGSAAFLVGHFSDPHEILTVLLPHVNDPSSHVRNNVIRVIEETMKTANITDVDPGPFIALLDSPFVTDRNKSLLVLSSIANSKAGKKALIEQGFNSLLAMLALKQPDNHEPAYAILKKITGRDLGDQRISVWQNWLHQTQHKQAV